MQPTVSPALPRAGRTLFAGTLVALSLFGDSYLYAVLPLYHAEAGLTLAATGWVLSANRYVRLLTNPLAGAVGGRLGWSLPFAAALWLAAATTAGYGLVTGLWLWIGMRALWGLCWSFLRLGGMAAVMADAPSGQRGGLMGLFTGVFRLGSLAGVVAGGYLADRLGFGVTALILAAGTAAGAVLGSLPPALTGRWGAPARPEAPPRAEAPASVPGGFWQRWLPGRGPEWAVCLGAGTLHLVTSGLVTSSVSLLVQERLGPRVALGPWAPGAATVAGLLLGARWLLDLAAGPAAGRWADRRGRGVALTTCTLLLAGALVAVAGARSLPGIAGLTISLFAAGTGAATILDAWAADLAARDPGRFLAAYNSWLDLGAATGPVLGFALAARFGLPAAYLAGAGALVVIWALGARLAATGARHPT